MSGRQLERWIPVRKCVDPSCVHVAAGLFCRIDACPSCRHEFHVVGVSGDGPCYRCWQAQR